MNTVINTLNQQKDEYCKLFSYSVSWLSPKEIELRMGAAIIKVSLLGKIKWYIFYNRRKYTKTIANHLGIDTVKLKLF